MIRLSFLILSFLLVYSCQQVQEDPVTVISGEITNPKGEIVTFSFDDEKITDTLDADNRFATTLQLKEPKNITFRHGEEYTSMYLRPGDDLYLTLDPEQFDESITYTGTAANINSYLAGLTLLNDSLISSRQMMMLPEKEFLATYDSISELKLSLLKDFNVTDETFIAQKKDEQKWEGASLKINYPKTYQYLNKDDSFQVSENYYAFKEDLDINDSTSLGNPGFENYVSTLIRLETSEKYQALEEKSQNDYSSLYLTTLDEMVSSVPVKSELLYTFLYQNFTFLPDDLRNEFISQWKNLNPEPNQIEKMDQKSAQWAELMPGNAAPGFTYVSIEGDTMSLDDFKGKLVYIDVWATWCGPCIGEHPSMEKLQTRFEGKDVVFVAVSIDSTPEPWSKMVADKNLGGVHLYAPGAWNSTIIKNYMIGGIPRFILIDREGKIIDPNASRPSGDIGDQLETLLTQEV